MHDISGDRSTAFSTTMHASGDCGYPIGLEVIVGFVVALAAHPTRVCIHQAEHEQWRPVVVTYCNVM